MKDRSGQILELQSLRGIAAIAVVLGHTLTFYYSSSSIGSMVMNGRGAVVIFFVLSGYVLTRSLRNSNFDLPAVVYFYAQRAFRIYPAIWAASLLGLWYLSELHWRIPLADGSFGGGTSLRADRFNEVWIIGSFTGMVAYLLPQLWSIHVEILGSLLMPAIAFMALRRKNDIWVLLLLAVTVSYLFGSFTPYRSALFLMDFVVGAALAGGVFNPLIHRVHFIGWTVIGGLLALTVTRFLPFDYYSPTAHLIETCFAAILVGLLAEGKQRLDWMKTPALLFIGEISYSIYLLHFVVQCTVAKGIAVAQLHEHLTISNVSLSILLMLLTAAITVPLAWLTFVYIEKPGIRLGRIILGQRPPLAA
jgi:peptidoglycan/LPS O-acetylase OafA/YrhL